MTRFSFVEPSVRWVVAGSGFALAACAAALEVARGAALERLYATSVCGFAPHSTEVAGLFLGHCAACPTLIAAAAASVACFAHAASSRARAVRLAV